MRQIVTTGILNFKNEIDEITKLSLGEANTYGSFIKIRKKWDETHIPVTLSRNKDPSLLALGTIDYIITNIMDTILELQQIVDNEYSLDMRYDVLALQSKLDKTVVILQLWEKSQSIWLIVHPLFSRVCL